MTSQDIHPQTQGNRIGDHPDSIAVPELQDNDFYDYVWFHKLIQLVYCLSLAIAGTILATFPVAGAIKDLKDAGPFLITPYAEWLAVNIAVIWIFAIIGVSTMDDDPMPQNSWTSLLGEKLASWRDHVKRSVAPSVAAWMNTIAWTSLVLGLTAGSASLSYVLIWKIVF